MISYTLINNNTVYRKDRTSRGSGVKLTINIIPFKLLDSTDNLEIISVSLLGKNLSQSA